MNGLEPVLLDKRAVEFLLGDVPGLDVLELHRRGKLAAVQIENTLRWRLEDVRKFAAELPVAKNAGGPGRSQPHATAKAAG